MQSTKNIHTIQKKKLMKTRITKNIFDKNERCRDVETQKPCKQGWEANIKIKPKLNNHFHISSKVLISTSSMIQSMCTKNSNYSQFTIFCMFMQLDT